MRSISRLLKSVCRSTGDFGGILFFQNDQFFVCMMDIRCFGKNDDIGLLRFRLAAAFDLSRNGGCSTFIILSPCTLQWHAKHCGKYE